MAENHYDLDYTGSMVDRILDTGYDLQNQGYIFRGLASHYTGTPTERTWLIAPTGSTGFGLSSPVPPGSIGICMYNGSSWYAEVLNTLTLDTAPTTGSGNGITSAAVKTLAESITNAIGQLEQSVSDRFTSLELEDTTGSLQAELLSITLKYVFEGEEETLTSLSILAATAEKAGLMSAADKQKLDAFVTNIRSLRIQDTTAQADQDTEITNTLKWTIGGVTEAITAFTLYAATTSKAGLMSAADKTALDTLPSLINAGYLYAGIATPSTVPSSTSAKIFYLAIEGGTYTGFNLNVTQGINIIYKSGDAWSVAQVVGIDNEPTAGSDNLVKSGGVKTELALGAVYDVSAHNNGATFESLSALLSDTDLNALIPTAVRKGGMSIKFVQSSDNKYVQYRLMANEWSTNTDDWAIVEDTVLVENPEFVEITTDAEDKILYGVKPDGDFYFGAGVPSQVQEEIDTTADTKVDKVEGKSLIDSDYAASKSSIESSEYLEIKTDAEDKILEATMNDGTKILPAGVKTTQIKTDGAVINSIENPEWIQVTLDGSGKIIEGVNNKGQKVINSELKTPAAEIKSINNKEFIYAIVDGEDKVLFGIRNDGSLYKIEKEEDDEDVSSFDDDTYLNVYKQTQQLYGVKWTSKGTFKEGYGTKTWVSGETFSGIPYSSVKEYLKYVGVDVSLHTFMTTVNDEHSLMYSENPNGVESHSAYGRTYHGVNCRCYFGTVCSGYVTTGLGSKIQWDSWAYQSIKTMFDVLPNQNILNLKVGDTLSEPGHVAMVRQLYRKNDGSLDKVELTEQAAPIVTNLLTINELENRVNHNGGIWCRYKKMYNNVNYKPSPFVLFDNEDLYNVGDYVYIDKTNHREYYICARPNRDSSFNVSNWSTVPEYTADTEYVKGDVRHHNEVLYMCISPYTSGNSFDNTKWNVIKGVFEHCTYPYTYNNDIITFAGDRAAFKSNDLIYVNYTKGGYSHMQLYKDAELINTYTLPNDDSYQINVSNDCAEAGKYKARLTDGTNFSRYTYFEVIDTQVNVTYSNSVAEITFSSSNGTPICAQVVEQSGGTLCHKELDNKYLTDGKIKINPLARLYAERYPNWAGFAHKNNLPMYARVIFEGEYGNVVSDMVYLDTVDTITGLLVFPDSPVDFGVIGENKNVILTDREDGNIYTFDFVAGESISIDVLLSIGIVFWNTELPSTLTSGHRYHVKVDNGIGSVIDMNI